MKDSLLALRAAAAGNLTATANATALDLGKGNVLGEMAVQFYIPTANSTSDTVDFIIQQSDDNFSSTKEQTYVPQVTNVSAATSVSAKFLCKRRYVRLRSVVAGGTPNFGAVTAYISTGQNGIDFNIANA